VPQQLAPGVEAFERYYDSRHSGRRLTWQGNLGTVDVRVRFANRPHDVNCSTQAACVLLAFENVDELSYEVSLVAASSHGRTSRARRYSPMRISFGRCSR
jgi:hypothetical protein